LTIRAKPTSAHRDAEGRSGDRDRIAMLADIGGALGATTDDAAASSVVLEALIPAIAAYAMVHRPNGNDSYLLAAFRHRDTDKERLLSEFGRRDDLFTSVTGSHMAEALRGGVPVLAPQVTPSPPAAGSADPRMTELEAALAPASIMIFPFAAGEEARGVLSVAHDAPEQSFDASDLVFVHAVAASLALALRSGETASGDSALDMRPMFQATSVGMAHADLATRRFLRVNAALCALTGYSEGELLTHTVDELAHPSDQARNRELYACLTRDEIPDYEVETRCVRKDGSVVWVQVTGTLLRDSAGLPLRALLMILDVTARKWVEGEAPLSRRWVVSLAEATRALTEAGPGPETVLAEVARQAASQVGDLAIVRLLSSDGRWLEPVAVDHADPAARAAVAAALADERHPADRGATGAALREGRPQRLDGDALTEARRQAGSDLWPPLDEAPTAALLAAPLRANGRAIGTLSVSRADADHPYDAADERFLQELADRAGLAIERARLFAQVRASEARLRLATETNRMVAWEWDPVADRFETSENVAEVYGLSGLSRLAEGFALIAPDDLPTHQEKVSRIIREGGEYQSQFRIIRPRDGQIVWLEEHATALTDAGGRVTRVVGVVTDVTARKRVEEERVVFFDALAHDIRNPLGAAKGQAQLARRRLQRGAEDVDSLHAALDRIDAAIDDASRLIDELLDVAHLRAGLPLQLRLETVDLVALAEECAEEVQRSTTRHAVRVGAATPTLVGEWDRARLARMLANLLGNAVKYSPRGGEIVVRAEQAHDADGNWAVLAVQDHGVGIPVSDLSRIFERFQRGGNVAAIGGTGIGLAGARQIVVQHGGSIGVESDEGVGSTFTVRLPLNKGDRVMG
jgi:PAS domain S-box-containing protein